MRWIIMFYLGIYNLISVEYETNNILLLTGVFGMGWTGMPRGTGGLSYHGLCLVQCGFSRD